MSCTCSHTLTKSLLCSFLASQDVMKDDTKNRRPKKEAQRLIICENKNIVNNQDRILGTKDVTEQSIIHGKIGPVVLSQEPPVLIFNSRF